MLSLMKRERAAWETRKSLLGSLNPGNESQLLPNGLRPGGEPPKPSGSPSLIDTKNFSSMVTKLSLNSPLKSLPRITNSYSMTSPCATKSQPGSMLSSQITNVSLASIQPSSCQTGSKDTPTKSLARNPPNPTKATINLRSATNSMPGPARTQMLNANIGTSAKTAGNPDMGTGTARKKENELRSLQPKYLRHNLWEEGSTLSPTTAEWSETARPLPCPPPDEVLNLIAFKTITDNADLFQVHTPIKVDVFKALLKNHPNQPFVDSVCAGLRDGFWPWADTLHEKFPVTHDESRPTPSDDRQADFI